MFDTVSVNLAWLTQDELDRLVYKKAEVINGLFQLFDSQLFINSVTVSTNTKAKVYHRFEAIRNLFLSSIL